jgi:hypothetical protein
MWLGEGEQAKAKEGHRGHGGKRLAAFPSEGGAALRFFVLS